MPETNQIRFSHAEVLNLLVREADVHEGLWALSFQVGMQVGRISTGPDSALPGASILIQGLGIQRLDEEMPITPGSTYVDAAKVNPKRDKGTK